MRGKLFHVKVQLVSELGPEPHLLVPDKPGHDYVDFHLFVPLPLQKFFKLLPFLFGLGLYLHPLSFNVDLEGIKFGPLREVTAEENRDCTRKCESQASTDDMSVIGSHSIQAGGRCDFFHHPVAPPEYNPVDDTPRSQVRVLLFGYRRQRRIATSNRGRYIGMKW